jgi:Flp pilus assembly protein TadD
MPLLLGWQSLMGADRNRRRELCIEAERCFRLARSTVGCRLAAELEAIGREFEKEADDLSARMQALAYEVCYSGSARQRQATYYLPKLW